jgi:Protein of unknown function (DUF2630)
MSDDEILHHITKLVDEEHELLEVADAGTATGDQHERLKALQVQLDQFWDLLRQRRARREFLENPDEASLRDPSIVEQYKQ